MPFTKMEKASKQKKETGFEGWIQHIMSSVLDLLTWISNLDIHIEIVSGQMNIQIWIQGRGQSVNIYLGVLTIWYLRPQNCSRSSRE